MTEPTAAVPVCYRHPDRETGIRCQRCERPICPDCMNSASVGFQCPSCVKEGAKSTRTGRLPYGGARVANATLATMVLIGLNVAVWLAITADGGNGSTLVDKLALIPNFTFGADSTVSSAVLVPGVAHGSWWQVVTSGFTHISTVHIALNMFALYFLGPPLEQILGRARFLTLYGVSLLTGSAAVMLFSDEVGATVGASGAIFGLFGALAVVTLKLGGDFRNVLSIIGLNLAFTFIVPGISWQGHLGGLVGGALVALVMVYAPKQNRAVYQFAGAAAVLLVALALIVVRAQDLATTTIPGLS
ncbi:rhomboid family intramembrane serine protease [Nocardioides marmoriginsengisoli]|uniref:Rhomboid family intramembrane serine protease n=1 Tax=Nocardioides marmoriginsengisoli TaxID=661483 RepID=A0A3N0CBH5_9ACTN|nr:rhomboid family intramembrane serine protease [Nocardioides marmoriginsengisoli]RNL60788.1 rhomboid family intramembrane serine protease [Nocardioides marmoriginsengisoli]